MQGILTNTSWLFKEIMSWEGSVDISQNNLFIWRLLENKNI